MSITVDMKKKATNPNIKVYRVELVFTKKYVVEVMGNNEAEAKAEALDPSGWRITNQTISSKQEVTNIKEIKP